MNPALLDPYVLSVLRENGWSASRRVPFAAFWARVMEADGLPCPDAAGDILRSLGGLRIWEQSPSAGLYFLERCQGEWDRLDAVYRKPLLRLRALGLEDQPRRYTGASFAFDALDAFRDQEIVLPFADAERAAGEALFPIGTVEPDGISCAAASGRIYTLFDDSVFLSGSSIEDYLNACFLKERTPTLLLQTPDRGPQ